MKTIIIDNLEWQEENDGNRRSLRDSIIYATTLGDGWRLPTIEELISIVDYNTYSPACKIDFCCPSHYWSSSLSASNSSLVWVINFCYGDVNFNYKDEHYYARCVRPIADVKNFKRR